MSVARRYSLSPAMMLDMHMIYGHISTIKGAVSYLSRPPQQHQESRSSVFPLLLLTMCSAAVYFRTRPELLPNLHPSRFLLHHLLRLVFSRQLRRRQSRRPRRQSDQVMEVFQPSIRGAMLRLVAPEITRTLMSVRPSRKHPRSWSSIRTMFALTRLPRCRVTLQLKIATNESC